MTKRIFNTPKKTTHWLSGLFFIIALFGSIGSSQAQTGGSTCNCNEYIYLNDVFEDLTHKFRVNASTGGLTEIGSPWLAANTIDNPHGLAQDLNGSFYIANGASDPIFKVSCEGVLLDPNPVIPNPFNGTELRTTNFFSKDNVLYIVSETEEQILAFDLCDYSLIGRMEVDGGQDIQTWGFYIDENNWYVPNRAAGNTNRMISGSLDISLYNNTATNSGSTLFDFQDGMPVGMTRDSDGNFYVIEAQNNIATLNNIRINKYASDGTFIAGITTATNDGANTNNGEEGWWGARGIVYSETSGKLYVSAQENCITVFDSDLIQLETLNLGNPTGGNPKAIAITTECCPDPVTQTQDVTFCNGSDQVGKKYFLNEIFPCDGLICGGEWSQVGAATGLTYDICDQSITISDAAACGSFTKSGGGTGPGFTCGAFTLNLNISVKNLTAPVIAGNQTNLCPTDIPAQLTVATPSNSNVNLSYQWQMSTTSCSAGFSNVGTGSTTPVAYQPAAITQNTYYRLVTTTTSGCSTGQCEEISNCVTLSAGTNCPLPCTTPDAGADFTICLPKTTLDLADATFGNEWVAVAGNPATAVINATTGVITGMTATGVYSFRLQKAGDPSCSDVMTVTVTNGEAPNVLCNDGSTSVTLEAPANLTNVVWYSMDGTEVGTGNSLIVTSNTSGLADGTEAYYYIGEDGSASGCAVELCCPVKFITQDCCPTPNCVGVTVIKN